MDIDEGLHQCARMSVMATTGKPPNPGLWGASVLAMGSKQKGVLVSCGGSDTNPAYSAISILDLKTMTWSTVKADNSDMPYISTRRWGHSATVVYKLDPTLVYLIGGWDSSSQYNDIHIFDVKSQTVKKVRPVKGSTAPSHRAGHTASAWGKNIVVFGGAYCKGGPYTFYNDVFNFNTDNDKWRELKCKGDLPCPRAQHSALVIGNRLIVVGGYTGKQVLNDVHCLDLTTQEWTRIETHGTPPTPIEDASAADFRVFPARGTAILLRTGDENTEEQVVRVVYVGHSGVHMLNLADWTWTQAKVSVAEDEAIPASLTCHSAVDITACKLALIGGTDGGDDPNNRIFCLEL